MQTSTPDLPEPRRDDDLAGWHLLEPEHMIRRIADDLAREVAGTFGPETVLEFVQDAYSRIAGEARIRTYLPALTARIAHDMLLRHARSQGALHLSRTPEILFVCVHNHARSVMAAALTAHHGGDRVQVRSAGSRPASRPHPATVEAMAERGIDVSGHVPRLVAAEELASSDVVITLGCGDACPVLPGKRYEDWPVPDPVGLDVDAVRDVRDEVEQRVLGLLAQVAPDVAAATSH